jgi:hypothetical protein
VFSIQNIKSIFWCHAQSVKPPVQTTNQGNKSKMPSTLAMSLVGVGMGKCQRAGTSKNKKVAENFPLPRQTSNFYKQYFDKKIKKYCDKTIFFSSFCELKTSIHG